MNAGEPERRRRGPVNRLALIGYTVLAIGACVGFARVEQIANRQDEQLEQAEHDRARIAARFTQTDRRQLEALRTIICIAQRNSLTSRQRTPEEKRIAVLFYQRALASIHARPCNAS